jgi:hypothetical protein
MVNRGIQENSLYFLFLNSLGNGLPELGKRTYKNFSLRKSNPNSVHRKAIMITIDRIPRCYETTITRLLTGCRLLVDLSIPRKKNGSD